MPPTEQDVLEFIRKVLGTSPDCRSHAWLSNTVAGGSELLTYAAVGSDAFAIAKPTHKILLGWFCREISPSHALILLAQILHENTDNAAI